MSDQQKYSRILLTGAAGGLGKVLRGRLVPFAGMLRVTDRLDVAPAGAGEEVVLCDLSDKAAVHQLVKGSEINF